MNSNSNKSDTNFLFKGQKKEFLDWLESLKISKYWLDTMSYMDSYALCKETYHILLNFKELDLSDIEKLFSLIEINHCLNAVYEKLHDSYLDEKLLLSKEQQEFVKIIILTYMELANAYLHVANSNKDKQEKLTEQHLALNICKGLQGLGIVFLTSAEIYRVPPKGFWLLSYQLFSAAEDCNVLETKVKIDEAIYSPGILFKKLVVFYAVDKNKCTAREINKIFESLVRGINYIQSYISTKSNVNTDSSGEVFGFSLNTDEKPSIHKNLPPATVKLLRYVEKNEVIKIIKVLQHETKELQNPDLPSVELLGRLLVTLEFQKQKRQTRITKKYNCRAIIGIDNLIDFLLDKEDKKHYEKHTKQSDNHDHDYDSLQLVLDWSLETELEEKNVVIEDLKITDSSMSGYGICASNNIIGKLKIGEVIGIIPDFSSTIKRIEICLIRRISVIGETVIFGVELIGLESTLIYIERENNPNMGEWVLFLFGSPNYDVGILCHKESNYQVGEAIFVKSGDKNIPCQLGNVLNETSIISHIKLIY